MVQERSFRGDLYFRISTILLVIPPLRERLDDIPALTEFLLGEIGPEIDRAPLMLSPSALERLRAHPWPGNIRELRNTLERAALSSRRNVLEPGDFGFDFPRGFGRTAAEETEDLSDLTLLEAEKVLIRKALEAEHGHVDRAAHRLGISRSSLYQRIQKHGIVFSKI